MRIIGTGSALPKKVVTNDQIAEFLNTSDEWISTRTGIKSRHVITDEKLQDLGAEAVMKALEMSGLSVADIDLFIVSNVVSEYGTPGLSCIVAQKVGLSCPMFDINCACPGFVYALDMAEAYYKELPDWIVISAQKRLPTDIRKALESVPVSTDEAKTALKMIVTMEPSWRMGDEVYLEKLTLTQNGIEYERTEKDMDDTDIATISLKLLTGKQEYKDAFEKIAAKHLAFFSSGQNYGILDGPVGDVIIETPAGRRKFENVSLPIGWILGELAPFLPKSWDYPGKNDEEE